MKTGSLLAQPVPGDEWSLRAFARAHSERGKDRLQQFPVSYGFNQVSGNSQLATARSVTPLAGRGEHHDRRSSQCRVLLDSLGYTEAVHIRHLRIKQNKGEGFLGCLRILHDDQAGLSALDQGWPHLPVLQ